VAGGIAAYKAAEVTRLLVTAGAEVRVVMTRSAQEFITPLTFQTLSSHTVHTELFDLGQESEIGHIKLAEQADLVLVAPATADLIARLAAGMGDDLLATLALVTRAPLLLAPAMNVNMWEHPIVQANVQKLTSTGRVWLVGPGSGFLACKMVGPGRLAEPADIVEAAGRLLVPHDLFGRRIVVTAGPTQEAIDAVRFVSNRSSGKMGYALARAAATRGARVTLISGPTALDTPMGVDVVQVDTANEMHDATTIRLRESDVIIMAAAVADYKPEKVTAGKLKKDDFGDALHLNFKRNPDVLAELGRARLKEAQGRRAVLVGFAAETEKLEDHARAKLRLKGCDLVVANDVSQPSSTFGADTNRVTIAGPGDKLEKLPVAPKDAVAHQILDRVVPLLPRRQVVA
jgi:phosphopantothenoylcysteine decarboxylase/phosphopantothenate--cysteine ligase